MARTTCIASASGCATTAPGRRCCGAIASTGRWAWTVSWSDRAGCRSWARPCSGWATPQSSRTSILASASRPSSRARWPPTSCSSAASSASPRPRRAPPHQSARYAGGRPAAGLDRLAGRGACGRGAPLAGRRRGCHPGRRRGAGSPRPGLRHAHHDGRHAGWPGARQPHRVAFRARGQRAGRPRLLAALASIGAFAWSRYLVTEDSTPARLTRARRGSPRTCCRHRPRGGRQVHLLHVLDQHARGRELPQGAADGTPHARQPARRQALLVAARTRAARSPLPGAGRGSGRRPSPGRPRRGSGHGRRWPSRCRSW